jgi:hypothetical protein
LNHRTTGRGETSNSTVEVDVTLIKVGLI